MPGAAFGSDFHDLSRLTDMGASLTSADEAALQGVLEELSVPARCHHQHYFSHQNIANSSTQRQLCVLRLV